MDMWSTYMNALRHHAWYAFIVHEHFHVSQHLTSAIDSVRKQDHRELKADADESLKDSRWTLLKRDHSEDETEAFAALERKGLKVAEAWNLRELFDRFWKFKSTHTAERFIYKWGELARQPDLEPMIKVAKMLEKHIEGLLGHCWHPITNADAEGFNSKIQTVKSNARGLPLLRKVQDRHTLLLWKAGYDPTLIVEDPRLLSTNRLFERAISSRNSIAVHVIRPS